ncbi:hypothetical protein VC180_17625 [Citrobacter braakii]|nr:hypothetical protein [Citrobacter braakii]MEB2724194.1 hypothetical protein [Citrobacter braakii]
MKHYIHMTHNRLVAGSSPAGATKHSKGWRVIVGPFVFSGDMPGIFQKGNHGDLWLFYDRPPYLQHFLLSAIRKTLTFAYIDDV